MTLQTTTLRPGYLVSLKTSLTGNVSYTRVDIEPERTNEAGETRARWETAKTVTNAAEHDAGTQARNAARTVITRVCSSSSFGLLCPEARSGELTEAIAEARRITDKFNQTARLTRLAIGVIVGRVADNDVEAVRAINSEVRGLLDEMESGLRRLDVAAVRDAASRAREIGQMLTPGAAERVQKAIDAARSTARRMVRAGEQAAQELSTVTLQTLASARTAFLDLDEPRPTTTLRDFTEPQARAIDLDPEPVTSMAAPAMARPQLELI